MNKLKILFFVILLIMILGTSEIMSQDCSYWHKSVGVKNLKYAGSKIDEKNPVKIIEGIECLLKLEGNQSRGAFSGATNFQVSELLPPSTVEICALYYISWLFYENYEHASGVALVDESNLRLNSKKSIMMAYTSYRNWFETVKEIGLEEARKQNLDPLKGSGVRWY